MRCNDLVTIVTTNLKKKDEEGAKKRNSAYISADQTIIQKRNSDKFS